MTDRLELLDKPSRDLLFHGARSANTFTDEPVSDEQLHAVYDLVKWGPTSMNIQPLRLLAVRSPEARATLVDAMSDGNKAKTAAAPLVLIVAADGDFHETLSEVFPHLPQAKTFFPDPVARAETAKLNASLQLGYLIVGIRAEGLAAGPMTGADFLAIDAAFFAGTSRKSFAVVNVGHPGVDAWFARSPRLDYAHTVHTV